MPTTDVKKHGRLTLSFSAALLAAPILSLAACGDDGGDPMMTTDSSVMEDASMNTPDATVTVPDAEIVDGEVIVPDATVEVPDAMVDAKVPECPEGQAMIGGTCRLSCELNEVIDNLDCGPGGTCGAHQDDDEVAKCWCDQGYEGSRCELCSTGFEPGANNTCKLNLPPAGSLMVWLDASEVSSLTINGDDEVTNWHDRRPGINEEADPPFGTARPTYNAVGRNNRGAVVFDGTDDYLTIDGFSGMSGNDVEVIIAADPRTGSTGIFGAVSGTDNWAFMLNRVEATNNFEMIIRDPAATSGGDSIIVERVSPARPMYLIGARGTSASPDSFFSIASDGTGDQAVQSHIYVEAQNNLNSPLNINIGRTQVGYLKGWVYEVLVYSKRLTTQERQEVTDYLRGKWNLP